MERREEGKKEERKKERRKEGKKEERRKKGVTVVMEAQTVEWQFQRLSEGWQEHEYGLGSYNSAPIIL